MAKRFVVKLGDGILRERSKDVVVFDDRLGELLDDMTQTMIAEDGVGLAAVQVGMLKRACVVYSPDDDEIFEFINPKILSRKGSQAINEGCLSVPGEYGEVDRPKVMNIEAFDRFGKKFTKQVSGYLAIICSHEFDHMDGILFIDKVKRGDKK